MKVIYRHRFYHNDITAIAHRLGFELVIAHDEDTLLEHLPNSDALWLTPPFYTQAVVEALAPERRGKLTWIGLTSAGYDIFARRGRPPGLTATYSAGVTSEAVAEHTLALLLALVRGLHVAVENRRSHRWDESIFSRLRSLEDMTVTVAGLGPVGRSIVDRLRPLTKRIIGVNRSASPYPGTDTVLPHDRLNEALAQSDAVIVATAMNASTRHLIDAARLTAMKPGGYVVNISRGPTVDTNALVDALASGHLAGAALDVTDPEPLPPEHPLWDQPNVIITPHAAAIGNDATGERLARLYAINVENFLHGRPLINGVAE